MRFSNKLSEIRGSIIWNAGLLTSGTVAGHAITILSTPLLTRLYTPEDYTVLAMYTAMVGLISVGASLRYNIAIPIPEKPADGASLLALSVAFSLTTAFVTFALSLLVLGSAIDSASESAIHQYLWLLPLGVAATSLYEALQYWVMRYERYLTVSRTRVTRSVAGVSAQAGLGFVGISPGGLLIGHLVYVSSGTISLIVNVMKNDRTLFRSVDLKSLVHQAKRYKAFPYKSVPEALLNTASQQLPIILIATSSAGPQAGLLMLAMQVAGLPMLLIGNSVAQVFHVDAGEQLRKGEARQFTLKTISGLTKIGLIPMGLAALAAPTLFPVIFGPQWAEAGKLVVWMTPWFLLQFICSPVSSILHVKGELQLAFLLQLLGFLLRIGVIGIAMLFFPKNAAEAFCISSAAFYAIYLGIIVRTVR